ncbi:MAG: hypothetical protein JNK37_12205 [Verrucomicrobiales bacterium]|nr:hypothetical protein [Verrucomicrobiales bacterium]
MQFIGAISALYFGIYLILPGCLCQLLEACGIQVHASNRPAQVCLIQGDSSSVPCHCHGVAAKAVDLEFATVAAPEPLTEVAPFDLTAAVLLLPALPTEVGLGRAPPALSHPSPATLRIFTGVFQV